MIPRAPTIPASLAALVTLLGLGLVYWSLTGLGLLRSSSTMPAINQYGGVGTEPYGPPAP